MQIADIAAATCRQQWRPGMLAILSVFCRPSWCLFAIHAITPHADATAHTGEWQKFRAASQKKTQSAYIRSKYFTRAPLLRRTLLIVLINAAYAYFPSKFIDSDRAPSAPGVMECRNAFTPMMLISAHCRIFRIYNTCAAKPLLSSAASCFALSQISWMILAAPRRRAQLRRAHKMAPGANVIFTLMK